MLDKTRFSCNRGEDGCDLTVEHKSIYSNNPLLSSCVLKYHVSLEDKRRDALRQEIVPRKASTGLNGLHVLFGMTDGLIWVKPNALEKYCSLSLPVLSLSTALGLTISKP